MGRSTLLLGMGGWMLTVALWILIFLAGGWFGANALIALALWAHGGFSRKEIVHAVFFGI